MISTGSLYLRDDITLQNVLLVPSFQFNLLFAFQLLNQLKYLAVFSTSACQLQGPSLKKPLEIGKASDGLYYYYTDSILPSVPISFCSDFSNIQNNVQFSSDKNFLLSCNSSCNNNDMVLFWHQRLGHIPYHKMRLIPFLYSKLPSHKNVLCDICPKAR